MFIDIFFLKNIDVFDPRAGRRGALEMSGHMHMHVEENYNNTNSWRALLHGVKKNETSVRVRRSVVVASKLAREVCCCCGFKTILCTYGLLADTMLHRSK